MTIIVVIDVCNDMVAEFLKLAAYHAAMSRGEPGCRRFEVLQDQREPFRFVLSEEFTDAAALAHHRATPHYRRWREEIAALEYSPRTRLELLPAWEQRRVVAPGCFDLLHAGHVHLLTEAKKAGERLIVLLNSDASVRRLKGPTRPIQPDTIRAAMLRALRVVDDVIIFDGDSPAELVKTLQPCLLVKGAEAGRPIPEYTPGTDLLIVPRLPGISTTQTIQNFPTV